MNDEGKTNEVIDMIAQRKARLASDVKKQEHMHALQSLAQATARRPPPLTVDSRKVQNVPAHAADSTLITMMMYADKSMTLTSAGMNRSYTAAEIAKAASLLPNDAIAKQLGEESRVNLVVRSLVQRGIASTAGSTFKLTAAGVMIGKSFFMPSERKALIDALDR